MRQPGRRVAVPWVAGERLGAGGEVGEESSLGLRPEWREHLLLDRPDRDAACPHPGLGVALWLHADDAQTLCDRLAADGVPITVPPFDSPFGRTFTFSDPDGYAVTIHDQA